MPAKREAPESLDPPSRERGKEERKSLCLCGDRGGRRTRIDQHLAMRVDEQVEPFQ